MFSLIKRPFGDYFLFFPGFLSKSKFFFGWFVWFCLFSGDFLKPAFLKWA